MLVTEDMGRAIRDKNDQNNTSKEISCNISNILIFSMIISLIWALFVVILGIIIRFFTTVFLKNVAESSRDLWRDRKFTKTPGGQDIVPLYTEVKEMPNVGDWLLQLGAIVLTCGSLTLMYSSLGLLASLKEIKIAFACVIMMIFIALALMVYTVQIVHNPFFGFHEIAKNQLTEILLEDYTVEADNSGFTALMNSIMKLKRCCGIRGAGDFRNVTFHDKSNAVHKQHEFLLPPACCSDVVFEGNNNVLVYTRIFACAEKGLYEPKNVNVKGCYHEVFKHIQSYHKGLLSIAFIIMIIWSAGQLILSLFALLTNKREIKKLPLPVKRASKEMKKESSYKDVNKLQDESITASPESSPDISPQYTFCQAPGKVKFKKNTQAFGKVSSFHHPDPMRIRSTEIW